MRVKNKSIYMEDWFMEGPESLNLALQTSQPVYAGQIW